MSDKQQNQAKVQKPEPARQTATAETAPLGPELLPAGLGQIGSLNGLPDHSTARSLRQASVLQIQRQFGNNHLQRMLIQRYDPDAGTDSGAADTAVAEARPTFQFVSSRQEGSRFDSSYTPVGPAPEVGDLDINLWVHITYAPFTRAMMRSPDFRAHRWTREQMADFAWTDDEKQTFETGFIGSVQSAWSAQHTLRLNDPDFSEYRCRVNVNVIAVSEPGLAHTRITAQKVPAGAPRFRSFVAGDTATLDIRDPSEPETHEVRDRPIIRQMQPFDVNKAEINSTINGQISEFVGTARRQGITPGAQPGGGELNLFLRGRASRSGSRRHNEQLGMERAEAVKQAINTAAGWGDIGTTSSVGSENASTDQAFQRVDVVVNTSATRQVQQNVAAHEAGHMFGLGDEYIDETPSGGAVPKFLGDKPTHYGDVEALVGTDAANEGLVQNSASMMSTGGTVQKGHYVYFLQALNQMTGKNWTVE
jgi:outer membrane protein OmpA-like peptidoglycan-associated protein